MFFVVCRGEVKTFAHTTFTSFTIENVFKI